jgi:hypothetical protein
VKELHQKHQDFLARHNARSRDLGAGRADGVPLVVDEALRETKDARNAALLGAQAHGGMHVRRPDFTIAGVPGAIVDGRATFAASGVVTGLTFERPVTVTAAVTFIGCTFVHHGEGPAIVTTGDAVFLGCSFIGDGADDIFDAGGNVYVIGCRNGTPAGLGAVIDIGVV